METEQSALTGEAHQDWAGNQGRGKTKQTAQEVNQQTMTKGK